MEIPWAKLIFKGNSIERGIFYMKIGENSRGVPT
jgi:hypothetical protein